MNQVDEKGRETTIIHFVFQVEPERIACTPNMEEFYRTKHHQEYTRTNDPRAVTCPQCKKEIVYREAMDRNG